MFFEEDRTQPNPTRWTPDAAWPAHMFKGQGLFDDFAVLLQSSGYFRLYLSTSEGFEPVGDYYRVEDLEEAVMQVLGTMAQVPDNAHAQ